MNITILANRDLASNIALNQLVGALNEHQLQLFLSDAVGKSNTNKPQPLLDLQFCEQQLINQVIFPAIDTKSLTYTPELMTFNGLAEKIDAPIIPLNNINQPEGLQKLKAARPDLILSIRFGKILKQPVLDIAKFGVLNLHSSLLPRYRGVMATFWTMLNAETHYGTTLHWIDSDTIDTGPIISQIAQPLDLTKCYLENVISLYATGCQQMIQAVKLIQQGKPLIAKAQSAQSSYFTFPNQSQLDQFFKQDLRLVDSKYLLSMLSRY